MQLWNSRKGLPNRHQTTKRSLSCITPNCQQVAIACDALPQVGWKAETRLGAPSCGPALPVPSTQSPEFLCLLIRVSPFVHQKWNRFVNWADLLKNFFWRGGGGAGEAGREGTGAVLKHSRISRNYQHLAHTVALSGLHRAGGGHKLVISVLSIVTNVPTDTEVNKIQDSRTEKKLRSDHLQHHPISSALK